jgi:uncharacterized protein YaeQ
MARLIVFAIFAHERLEFGRGISSDHDPDLWRRDLTGVIEQWIELGQPEESDIRKACGLAREVIIVTYSGNSADVWWSKNSSSLTKQKNLQVMNIDAESLDQATRLLDRRMTLTALIQDGEFQLSNGIDNVVIISNLRE